MQIIFLREKSSKAITFRISKRTIWISIMTLIISFLFLFSFGAWSIFQFIPDFAKINVLTNSKQTNELFNDLGVIKGRVDALEKSLKEMESGKKTSSSLDSFEKNISTIAISSINTTNARDLVDEFMVKLDGLDSKVGLLKLTNTTDGIFANFYPSEDFIPGRITSNFGPRVHPISGRLHTHTGTDYAAPIGTPVKAIADGIIVATYISKFGLGKSVDIDHGGKYISRYAHLDGIVVKEGDLVKAGSQIARVGSTGSSTGPHLHLEIEVSGRRVNPFKFLLKFRRNDFEKSA